MYTPISLSRRSSLNQGVSIFSFYNYFLFFLFFLIFFNFFFAFEFFVEKISRYFFQSFQQTFRRNSEIISLSVYYNYVNSFRELLFVLILDYLDIQLNTKKAVDNLKV